MTSSLSSVRLLARLHDAATEIGTDEHQAVVGLLSDLERQVTAGDLAYTREVTQAPSSLRAWTTDEDTELWRLYTTGETDEDTAKLIGRPVREVRLRERVLGRSARDLKRQQRALARRTVGCQDELTTAQEQMAV